MATAALSINPDRLMQILGQAVGEIGAAFNGALVILGDRLGLYKAMWGAGPMTAEALAAKTGMNERYLREWLSAQAAGSFLEYDRPRIPLRSPTSTRNSSPTSAARRFCLRLSRS